MESISGTDRDVLAMVYAHRHCRPVCVCHGQGSSSFSSSTLLSKGGTCSTASESSKPDRSKFESSRLSLGHQLWQNATFGQVPYYLEKCSCRLEFSERQTAALGRVPKCAVSKNIIFFVGLGTGHTLIWALIFSAISLGVRILSGDSLATSGQ